LQKEDIFDIWRYFAKDSEAAADRVEQGIVERGIYDACAFVAEDPSRGHYRPETKVLQVVAALHGKRNIKRILKQR
jgi:plasmid stabilization system protein ParE